MNHVKNFAEIAHKFATVHINTLQVSEGEYRLASRAGRGIAGARLLHDCRVHGGRVQVVIVNVPDVNERRVGGVEHCGDGLIGVNADGVAAGAPHYVVVEYQGQLGVDILLLDW